MLFVISPDEMARQVSGAGVTNCKGLYDKMQLTVITPKGMERRVDTECPGLKAGLEASSAKLFLVHSGAQPGISLSKDTGPEPSPSFLGNGQRWKVILDPRFMSSKKRYAAGLKTPDEEGLNVERSPRDGTGAHVN